MPLLQPISGRAYYLPGANNLGIVLNGEGGAVAIDTGIDKDTGRLIRKALDEMGVKLHAIISTHHHADHIGGNDYLVRTYPAVEVCAPRLEAGLIEIPEMEPIYLSFGAAPVPALQTKWLMAKGVPVSRRFEGPTLDVAGVSFEVVPLPGHSIGQIGVAIDGGCFAADGFFGTETLNKHGIPYAHNIGTQIESLHRLAQHSALYFLPGHGALVGRDTLEEAINANLAAIERASAVVHGALEEPGDLFAVANRVRESYGLNFAGLPQYVIFVSAVGAHLSHLESQKQARVELAETGAIWSAA